MNGPLGLADLVVDGDGTIGAHGGALPAADAAGLREVAAKGERDSHVVAAAGQVDDAHANGFITQNALAGGSDHSETAVVQSKRLRAVPEAHPAHVKAHGQLWAHFGVDLVIYGNHGDQSAGAQTSHRLLGKQSVGGASTSPPAPDTPGWRCRWVRISARDRRYRHIP